MDKYDEYLNDMIKENKTTSKKHKRLWIPAVAAVTALVTAGAAIAVSASTAEPQDTEPVQEASEGRVMLNLTDTSEMEDTSETVSAGYVLTDVSDVVDEVLPSVVSITSRQLVNYFGDFRYYDNGSLNDLWDLFFGDSDGGSWGYRSRGQEEAENNEEQEDAEMPEAEEVPYGMGSGTIIAQNSTELLILTSYHVVEGSSSLYVTFVDGSDVDGYIKAADEEKDIAVVAIPLEDVSQETLDAIKIATISTEAPDVGDGVIVLGNSLGYGISVTTGIISALDREIYAEGRTLNVIQTDAAINNGNSGGCMLNSKGEVIGISEAKVTLSYVEGMCYAIPVADNLDLIQDLLNAEETFDETQNDSGNGQAFLGIIRGRDVTSDLAEDFGMPMGVYVYSTVEGGGAEEAGIMSGDIIVGIDDSVISSFEELQYQLSLHKPGDVVTLVINRLVDGSYISMTLDVTLTERIG